MDEFKKYNAEITESIKQTKKKIAGDKKNRKYVKYDSYPLEKLRLEIEGIVSKKLNIKDQFSLELVFPPANVAADLCFGVFDLSKMIGENPNDLAKKISQAINAAKNDLILDTSVIAGFVNLTLDKKKFFQQSLECIESLGAKFGENDVYAGQTVLLDYSAPNIAKPIGVGHLRSTIIGQALSNLYVNSGYVSIKDNHIGDWGTQFGALIYAYKAWGDEAKIEKDPINELKNLYVKFHQVALTKPEIEEEARNYFFRLEKKDPELLATWKHFRDLSLKDFDRIYKMLGVSFDLTIGESYFVDQAEKVVDECLRHKLCYQDKETGAVVVGEADGLPSFLLRKNDGASLYMSRDIATILFRISTFHPDVILYVVGTEQDLNFKQLFSFCQRSGYLPKKVKAEHISFGLVLLDGKKMSTRRGTVIELDGLIKQSVAKSKEILLSKNSKYEPKELDQIAKTIGLGAIIYNDLRQSRTKNISFDWQRMLDLEGGSAVYLQYTYVRINSIIKKLADLGAIAKTDKKQIANLAFEKDIEFAIARKIAIFPSLLLRAQQSNAPHYVAVYLEELAQLFNSFYNEVSIVNTEDENLKKSRIILSQSVALVIKKGLSLLNIDVPERM
ncbi:MAG: arginine--tRNA ligase [Patescibacteria group bacterium]